MKPRSFLLALSLAALGLSQVACASLARPDEITISAEPAQKPAPAPQPAAPAGRPAPAGNAAAEPAPGGGG